MLKAKHIPVHLRLTLCILTFVWDSGAFLKTHFLFCGNAVGQSYWSRLSNPGWKPQELILHSLFQWMSYPALDVCSAAANVAMTADVYWIQHYWTAHLKGSIWSWFSTVSLVLHWVWKALQWIGEPQPWTCSLPFCIVKVSSEEPSESLIWGKKVSSLPDSVRLCIPDRQMEGGRE